MSEENTNVATPPEAAPLSFENSDFAADIAKLAAAQGIATEQKDPVVTPPETPAQPESPAAVTPPVEATKTETVVPEKFKAPDGSVDTEKLNKSTVNAEEALARYKELEKELARKRNEVRAKENAYINPPAASAPVPVIPVNADFAKKLDEDIAREGAGVVLAKLFTAAQAAAEEKMLGELAVLKDVNAENRTTQQVKAIGKKDPWVYTPEGMNTLAKILEDQPYLWQAKDPYKAAYLLHKGNVASQSNSQVLTPTPQARPSAPVPTGQAVNKAATPVIKLDSKEAIDNHLRGLSAEQQKEFFKRAGYPGY